MSKLGRKLAETEGELCDHCGEYQSNMEGHKRVIKVTKIMANLTRMANGYSDKGFTGEEMRRREDQRHNIAKIIKTQGGEVTEDYQ